MNLCSINGWSILAVGFVLPTALRLLFSFSKRAALLRDHAIIKLPFLGDIVLNLAVNRFLRSLILMQQAGIVITEALASSRDVVDNKVLESSLQRVENAVANGWTLSKAMTREKVFPPLVLTMVGVGERSGSLTIPCSRLLSITMIWCRAKLRHSLPSWSLV